jgi:hypothetical protein
MKKKFVAGLSILFIIAVSCIFAGCEKKQSALVTALLVLDDVPRRISIGYFEQQILARPELTGAEIKYLKSVYKHEKDTYVVNVPLYEKTGTVTNGDEILRILRKTGMIPLFPRPSDPEPGFALPEWKEVTCPEYASPKKEAFKGEGGKEETVEWQKIQADKNVWWVAARDLLVKNTEETEGVVLKNFDLFKYPVFNIAYRIGRYERGMKVKSNGYMYPERIYKNMYLSVDIYDKEGWCPASNVVLNARTGVMKDDETLFDNPEDLKSNRNASLQYKKLELVPMLEIRKDGWVKVVTDSADRYYYIKNGKDVISDDPVDIAFASYVREYYNHSKAIEKEFADTLGAGEKVPAIGKIANVRDKLTDLDVARKKIEEYLNLEDYKNSVFVRPGSPYSLGSYTQELFEIVNESEYVLGTEKGQDTKKESKKGTEPGDQ